MAVALILRARRSARICSPNVAAVLLAAVVCVDGMTGPAYRVRALVKARERD
jgi:hypothetical protein